MRDREIYLHKTAWVYLGQQELWTEFGSQFCHEPHLNNTLDKLSSQLFNKIIMIDQSIFCSFLNKEKFISSSIIIYNWNRIGSKFIFIFVFFQTVAFGCGRWIRTVLLPLSVESSLSAIYREVSTLISFNKLHCVFSESYRWKCSVAQN